MAVDDKKKYVRVEAWFQEDGTVHPTCIILSSGSRYTIESVLDIRPAVCLAANTAGMRYTVRIGSHVTYLYQSGTRWFVEQKQN